MTGAAVRVFRGRAEDASQARRWVRALAGATGSVAVDEAELAAGELVANAIRHTRSGGPGGLVTVAVTAGGEVHVHDQGDGSGQPGGWLAARRPGGVPVQAVSGRGLAIVAAVSAGWGCQPAARCPAAGPDDPAVAVDGCCVWCRPAPCPAASARPSDSQEEGAYAGA